MKKIFKISYFFILAFFFSAVISCSGKKSTGVVNLDQINQDGSTDYKYIFREDIIKEKEKITDPEKDIFKN